MTDVARPRRISPGPPARFRSRARRPDWLASIGVFAFAFTAAAFGFGFLLGTGDAAVGPAAVDRESARFAACPDGATPTCVIDGDTFRYRGDSIRIADIDTPEARNFGCPAEKARADAATRRLTALLNEGPFTLGPYERSRDRYGRALHIVTRDGQSLGRILVAEGLAREWDGARRGWC